MILDSQLAFDIASAAGTDAFPFAVGTGNSVNTIDLTTIRDIGIGRPLNVLVLVTTAFAGGANATLSVALQGSVDNTTWTTYYTSPAYVMNALNIGSRLLDMKVPRPPDGVAEPRYLRMAYIVGTAVLTGGALSAYLVLDRYDQLYQNVDNSVQGAYPAGITIAN